MQTKLLPAVLLATLSLPAIAQSDGSKPPISGVITRIASDSDFDLNGYRVVIMPATEFRVEFQMNGSPASKTATAHDLHLHVGQVLGVVGKVNNAAHTIAATQIAGSATATSVAVSGSAVINAVLPLPARAPAADHLVRADGYAIRITQATQLKYAKTMHSPADLHTDVWITYEGTLQPDGTVHAKKVSLVPNTISPALAKLRKKWEYNPAAVPADTRQYGADKFIRGVDPKQFPPSTDTAMQARLERIGATLVPQYQRELPASEPTRLNFRFYLLDAPTWRDAAALPNGIILVPHHLVERLQNDSQVAAFLADKVACLLEKQPVPVPLSNGQLATAAATDTAMAVVPFAGLADLAVALPLGMAAVNMYHHMLEQRERVSLVLLHDAGYDLTQAPVAFWLIAPKDPKPIAEVPIPQQSAYLYETIGQLWPVGAAGVAGGE